MCLAGIPMIAAEPKQKLQVHWIPYFNRGVAWECSVAWPELFQTGLNSARPELFDRPRKKFSPGQSDRDSGQSNPDSGQSRLVFFRPPRKKFSPGQSDRDSGQSNPDSGQSNSDSGQSRLVSPTSQKKVQSRPV